MLCGVISNLKGKKMRLLQVRCNVYMYLLGTSLIYLSRNLSTSCVSFFNQKWAEYDDVLLHKPDYTFLDGRPTPYGVHQRKRMQREREVAQQILTLSKEIDFAKERFRLIKQKEEQRKAFIIQNKLKPKGALLLAKK